MNSTELYKDIVGIPPDEELLKARRQAEEVKQLNLEAWAVWREIPQTKLFIDKLWSVKRALEKEVADIGSRIPNVNEFWIRIRLAQISLLTELINETIVNGNLKEDLFNPVNKTEYLT